MSTTSTNWKYLAPRPDSTYRQLFLKDRRISARMLYGYFMSEEEPHSLQQIAAEWNLPLEAVQEAIAYCEANPQDWLEDNAVEEAIMEATGMNDRNYRGHPRSLSLQERIAIEEGARQRFRTK